MLLFNYTKIIDCLSILYIYDDPFDEYLIKNI
jgi:hypothetical protein